MHICIYVAFLVAQLVKTLPAMQETLVPFLGWEDPREEGMAYWSRSLFQYSSRENSHGPRSLVGYSPPGHKKSDMTE